MEENIIAAVPDEQLEVLAAHPEHERAGARRHTLALRLRSNSTDFPALRAAAGRDLRRIIIEAALGTVPDGTPDQERSQYRSHAQVWFKSVDGGRELARKLFELSLWPTFRAQLLPFCNAVADAVGLDEIADILP
jgi:putative ATP-dependent endonuclease of OLD family